MDMQKPGDITQLFSLTTPVYEIRTLASYKSAKHGLAPYRHPLMMYLHPTIYAISSRVTS